MEEDDTDVDALPYEVREVPDEDHTDCGPSEEDLAEFELKRWSRAA